VETIEYGSACTHTLTMVDILLLPDNSLVPTGTNEAFLWTCDAVMATVLRPILHFCSWNCCKEAICVSDAFPKFKITSLNNSSMYEQVTKVRL
jgi:hypothetical protein